MLFQAYNQVFAYNQAKPIKSKKDRLLDVEEDYEGYAGKPIKFSPENGIIARFLVKNDPLTTSHIVVDSQKPCASFSAGTQSFSAKPEYFSQEFGALNGGSLDASSITIFGQPWQIQNKTQNSIELENNGATLKLEHGKNLVASGNAVSGTYCTVTDSRVAIRHSNSKTFEAGDSLELAGIGGKFVFDGILQMERSALTINPKSDITQITLTDGSLVEGNFTQMLSHDSQKLYLYISGMALSTNDVLWSPESGKMYANTKSGYAQIDIADLGAVCIFNRQSGQNKQIGTIMLYPEGKMEYMEAIGNGFAGYETDLNTNKLNACGFELNLNDYQMQSAYYHSYPYREDESDQYARILVSSDAHDAMTKRGTTFSLGQGGTLTLNIPYASKLISGGAYSWSFEPTHPTPVEELGVPTRIEHGISLYPNPVSGILNIDATIGATCAVSIEIFDIYGKKAGTVISDGQHAPGTEHLRFDASNLAEGAYIVKFTQGTNVQSEKFVVIH